MNAQQLLLCIGIVLISFSGKTQTTWYQVTVPTQEQLNDIQFVDELTGYIVGESGTFLRTLNGGNTWDQPTIQGIPTPQNQQNFIQIDFIDALNGYLVIEDLQNIYFTSDGGLNWTEVVNGGTNQCFPACVSATAVGDFFIGGSDCFQGGTINQVQQSVWTNQTINFVTWDTGHFVTEMDFEGNLGLAALNNEFFLRSTDAGATWDSINSNIGNGNVLTSVMIATNDTCYAGYNQNGGGFGVLYSTDAGLTWQEEMNSATFYYPAYYGFTQTTSGKAYCASVPSNTDIGVIFERVNGNWQYVGVDEPVYAMDSYGNDVTFAVGENGYVVVNKDLGGLSIEENDEQINLLELFPNPANMQIEWNCNDCSALRIEILDLHGKCVKKVANYGQNSIDVSDLNSGMYIISIQTETGSINERFLKE